MAANDPADTVIMDTISRLPDDVLLDILGRLATAGDVKTVAKTSILSRRWRSLPWSSQITNVFLDVGDFFHVDDDSGGWIPVRPRKREFWDQHEATARFTDALARFLAAPPSNRVFEKLSLKFILTKHDLVRRIGALVAHAVDAGAVKNVELEIVTELSRVDHEVEERIKPGYGDRFKHLLKDCPGAFRRRLTKLTLQNVWFRDTAEVNDLIFRGCDALEFLSLTWCGLTSPALDGDEAPPDRWHWPVLSIDAPQSRLQMLLCDWCHIGGVELVQAPALAALRYLTFCLRDYPRPITFGCAPSSFKGLFLSRYQGATNSFKLSELLANSGGQLEWLILGFEGSKIWLEPERPEQLRAALGRLTHLDFRGIPPECNLSWVTFLLEAAPLLERLDIQISNRICRPEWHKEGDRSADLTWELPSPDFTHRRLKHISFHRAFHVEKDLPMARLLMELAMNLQTVTLVVVKSLGCQKCTDALPNFPDLAKSRLRFAEAREYYVDALVKKLKDGSTSSAQIEIQIPDLV
ncbi:hypothetical protein EJB05_19329, partial [Eragrostis curvula]